MIDLRNCDCFELLATLPDKSVDIIYTDPPYDAVNHRIETKWVGTDKIEKLAKELKRVVKSNSWVIFFGLDSDNDLSYSHWKIDFAKYFKFKQEIIWQKRSSCPFANLMKIHENIAIFGTQSFNKVRERAIDSDEFNSAEAIILIEKINELLRSISPKAKKRDLVLKYLEKAEKVAEKKRTWDKESIYAAENNAKFHEQISNFDTIFEGKLASTIISASPSQFEREKIDHPTIKPLKLIVDLLKLVKKDDTRLVLDMFSGSGTTAMACKKLGLDFVGCELDQKFYDASIKRIEASKPNMEMDL